MEKNYKKPAIGCGVVLNKRHASITIKYKFKKHTNGNI
jgi:hypothetical protein